MKTNQVLQERVLFMKFYANLHTHSTHSDGVYSPQELVRVAKAEGYHALAITDHDTVTAYPELKAACEKEGMDCIFGVEFSSVSPVLAGRESWHAHFHITAYHFDPEYPAMKRYLEALSWRKVDLTRRIFDRGVQRGTITNKITWTDVEAYNPGVTYLCNNHVFAAMQKMGLAKESEYLDFYHANWDDKDNFKEKIAYKWVEDVIGLILDAGGIPIVAHPVDQLEFMDMLLEAGLQGIEVWHPDVPVDQQEQAYRIGLEKGLYISGGSDHSGLCGGLYSNFKDPKQSPYYTEPGSAGTTFEYYMEIKNRRLNR